MAEFSALEAAQFAFKKRDKRFVLASTSLAYMLGSLALAVALLAAAWPQLEPLVSWYLDVMRASAAGGEPPAPPRQPLFAIAPLWAIHTLLGLLWFAAFEAACLRWLVRGERGGVFGISFGADTWRVFAVYWYWLALAVGFCIATALLYMGLAALGGAHPILRLVAMLLGALAPLALFALLLWGAVRLSPAAALSIAKRRLTFLGTWRATSGRFWALLGAFVIVIVGYIVATLLLSVLRLPLNQAMHQVITDAMSTRDIDAVIASFAEVFSSPLVITLMSVYVIAATALSVVLYVAWFGVNARAVQDSVDEASAAP